MSRDDDLGEVTRVAGLPFAVALAGLVVGNALSGPWSDHGWAWWCFALYAHLATAYAPLLAGYSIVRAREQGVPWRASFAVPLLATCARLGALTGWLWALLVVGQWRWG